MKKGQEPAYPCKGEQIVTGQQSYSYVDENGVTQTGQNNIFGEVVHNGISQRLLIAGLAMQGILANPGLDATSSYVAKLSLEHADELLKQDEK